MSTPQGQSGYQLQQPPSANPNGYGGPNMRYGDPIGSTSNWGYAQQNLPNTPFSYQEQAAGLYGTPFQSNPNQYGRWNWASQMPPPQQQPGNVGGGYQPGPGAPPIPPGTPPAGNGMPQTGGAPGGPGLFGMTKDQQQSTQYNAGVPQTGDIWSNPAFANVAAGSGGLFGPSAASQQLQQQKVQEALARRAARGV